MSIITLFPKIHITLVSILVLWLSILVIYLISISQNHGVFVYALDDAYIHLAVSKNLAINNIWGVTEYHFSSSSSSILWTISLAILIYVFGNHEIIPLLFNIFLSTVLIFMLSFYVQKYTDNIKRVSLLIFILAVIFVAPIPALIFSGMEHILHILLFLVFFFTSISFLNNSSKKLSKQYFILLVIAPLLTAARYESLFVIFIMCLLLLYKRFFVKSIFIGIIALLPLLIFGLISVENSWFFFPNSVLLKGNQPNISGMDSIISFFRRPLASLWHNPHLFFTIICFIIIGRRIIHHSRQLLYMLLVYIASFTLHIIFADTGWFYRYDAYLTVMGFVLIFISLENKNFILFAKKRAQSYYLSFLIFVILGFTLVYRGVISTIETPQAMNDRYYEHFFPAKFVSNYYDNSTVVVNDLGAIAYFTKAKILDMYGLGSIEPILFRKKDNGYSSNDLEKWARKEKATIAILQIQWSEVNQRIPENWVKVSEWIIPRNVVFHDTKVGFFATDYISAQRLKDNLHFFDSELPKEINQNFTNDNE